eukprot:jgi/Galph1/2717/GphlegSOOS_G1414.1
MPLISEFHKDETRLSSHQSPRRRIKLMDSSKNKKTPNCTSDKSRGASPHIGFFFHVRRYWHSKTCGFALLVFVFGILLLLDGSYSRILQNLTGRDKLKTTKGSETHFHWDSIAGRVAFAIKTGSSVIEERFKNPNNTWLRRVPNYMVISDVSVPKYQAVGLKELLAAMEETPMDNKPSTRIQYSDSKKRPLEVTVDHSQSGWWYVTLLGKFKALVTIKFCRLDREKNLPGFHSLFKKFDKMDWYVMCDDDTYFFLDGLAEILQHPVFQQAMKEEIPIYMGNQFNVALCEGYDPSGVTNGSLNPWFAHGGSGIVLNWWALEALSEVSSWCMRRFADCWAGDIKVGLCFRELGIEIVPMGNHFVAVSPKSYFESYASQPPYKQSQGNDLVASFHHCDEEEFGFLATLEEQIIQKKEVVRFKDIAKIVSPNFHFSSSKNLYV